MLVLASWVGAEGQRMATGPSVGPDIEDNKVRVGTQHVAKLKCLLLEKVGTLDPFLIEFGHPFIPF